MSRCNILQTLDELNHYDTTAPISEDAKRKAIQAMITKYRLYGELSLRSMSLIDRQTVVDVLFSSRNLEEVIGNVYTKNDIEYFGFTTRMNPINYLSLAKKRGTEWIHTKRGEEFADSIDRNILEFLKNPKKYKFPKLGVPFLTLKLDEGKLVVVGHEGRHRSEVVRKLFHIDVDQPVDILFSKLRTRDLTPEILDMPIINQDGRNTDYTLRSLRNEQF